MLLPLLLTLAAEGIWQSPGYGHILAVDTKRVQIFDISPAGCVEAGKLSLESFESLYGNLNGNTLDRYPTRDTLTRLPALPAPCLKPLRTKDPATNLEVFAATLEHHYPFFAARSANWPSLIATARQRLQKGDDLYDIVTATLKPIRDGHLTLTAGKRTYEAEPIDWKTLRTTLRETLQGPSTPLTASAQITANRRVLYGKLNITTGYIAILAEGGWAEGLTESSPTAQHIKATRDTMNSILTELKGINHLVLDLRVNSGGYDAVAMEIASRFITQPTVVFRKHATGTAPYDVTLHPSKDITFTDKLTALIGNHTISAGETLALALSALPNATLIGQPTRGELSDAIPKQLPNGWSFTVSLESFLTSKNELVEAKGVQPKILTTSTDYTTDIKLALTNASH